MNAARSMINMVDYEDYIIRMKELDRKPDDGKKLSRLRSFLGGLLEKPLVVDFSRDWRSSYTVLPKYLRPILKKK